MILLNETWMKPEEYMVIPGYTIIRYDRHGGYGGIITENYRLPIYGDTNSRNKHNKYVNSTKQQNYLGCLGFLCKVQEPLLIIVDHYSHQPLWDSKMQNQNGRIYADIITDFNYQSLIMDHQAELQTLT